MRIRMTAVAGVALSLLLAQCANAPSPPPLDSMTASELSASVKIYDVPPPSAIPLGPVRSTACEGTRDMAMSFLLAEARAKGGNAVSAPVCVESGMSWSCSKSASCEGMAFNVPPPPPPKLVKPAPKRPRR